MSPPCVCPIFRWIPVAAHRRGLRLRTLTAYLPALVWAAIVFGIGSLHHIPQPRTGLPLDKIAHFTVYGVLGALAAGSWLRAHRKPAAFIVIALALSVGAADELHQRTVAGRFSDIADFAADTAGVLIGFTLVARRRASLITGNE